MMQSPCWIKVLSPYSISPVSNSVHNALPHNSLFVVGFLLSFKYFFFILLFLEYFIKTHSLPQLSIMRKKYP